MYCNTKHRGRAKACLFKLGNRKIDPPNVTLNGENIVFTDTVKYLGITLSSNLHFADHCHEVASAARRMVGAFRRKFGKAASKPLKAIYEQCIRPKLDYGCIAWSPTQQQSIDDLEKAQKFAARSILNNWTIPYTDALAKLGWTSLVDRRSHLKLIHLYKSFHKWCAYPDGRLVRVVDSGKRIVERLVAPHHLVLETHRSETFLQSFENSAIRLWNALPRDIALGKFESFKRHIALMKT